MAIILCETPASDPAETSIEMGDITEASQTILAERDIELDAPGTSIHVTLGAMTHTIEGWDFARIGERTLFGIVAENKDSGSRAQVETITGPVRFRADQLVEPQFLCEDSVLARIKFRCMGFGRAAMRMTGLVVPLPEARQSTQELYESAAPGIKLCNVIDCLLAAKAAERMSEEEAGIILKIVHDSAREALEAFHNLELVHGHAHMSNFNVNIATGEARLFDYTLAMEMGEDTAFARPLWDGMNDANPSEDIDRFESRWRSNIGWTGLTATLEPVGESERQAALVKLERAVVLYALKQVIGDTPSEAEIDRYIEARRDLISEAPTVSYPQLARAA